MATRDAPVLRFRHYGGTCARRGCPTASTTLRQEKHEEGLPTQKAGAGRPPRLLEPTGFQPPEAGAAQAALEHNLPRVGVEGSNPFARSSFPRFPGDLCSPLALQSAEPSLHPAGQRLAPNPRQGFHCFRMRLQAAAGGQVSISRWSSAICASADSAERRRDHCVAAPGSGRPRCAGRSRRCARRRRFERARPLSPLRPLDSRSPPT